MRRARPYRDSRGGGLIFFTFFIGFILTIIPLPSALTWYRPSWLLLILIYWLIEQPHQVGVVVSWVVGLLLDLITGSLPGVHALVFTIVAYVILKFHLFLRGLSVGQKLFLVFIAEIINLWIPYLIDSHFYAQTTPWRYWLPILTTAFFWPVTVIVLGRHKPQRQVI